ncbi:sigma-70 family RNA polymerase sigma factor [Collimonas sp. H4R21]|uniref:Sigma-70 family RNA polymerase sigma factor n=1 Tax=Collimonas rhizosphaerae TaxID=3126357 RepID=A0ABU9Q130_9BURK
MTRTSPPDLKPLSSIDLDRLRPTLHRYCARMVGSALDGEDIVQEAMLRALESGVPDRPIENPEGWLFRIAHNLALDFLRRRARLVDTQSDYDVDLIAHPVDEQARREAAAATFPVFMQIPASQRSVVILFDVLEYSAEEVGALLGATVPAVKSTLQRGRSSLRTLASHAMATGERTTLPDAEQQLLRRYVDLFNARDFDTLRTMLAADVQLDLVNRLRLQGPAVGEYFARYGQTQGWRAWPGVVEGRPAILIQQHERPDMQPDYFVVLGWTDQRVSTIRDFLFARYATADAEHYSL